MSRELQLFNGRGVALVDDSDWEHLVGYRWCLHQSRNHRYACRYENGKRILLHCALMPNVEIVAHINHDGLDCRRENLRPATRAENAWNGTAYQTEGRTSQYRGVCRYRGVWRAQISVNGTDHFIGDFTTEERAARAWDEAAREFHRDWNLNFPMDGYEDRIRQSELDALLSNPALGPGARTRCNRAEPTRPPWKSALGPALQNSRPRQRRTVHDEDD